MVRDMTVENGAGTGKQQAVALLASAERAVAYPCAQYVLGYQDALYAHAQRQLCRDCEVAGTVDVVFGNAAAVAAAWPGHRVIDHAHAGHPEVVCRRSTSSGCPTLVHHASVVTHVEEEESQAGDAEAYMESFLAVTVAHGHGRTGSASPRRAVQPAKMVATLRTRTRAENHQARVLCTAFFF
jgi:pectin methylesterase-like acyl-CoA thioesterase